MITYAKMVKIPLFTPFRDTKVRGNKNPMGKAKNTHVNVMKKR